MIHNSEIATIGFFGKPHGYAGEINFSFDGIENGEEFFEKGFPLIIEMDGIPVPFYIASWRSKGADYLVKLEDFQSIESVRVLVNREVKALKKEILEIDPEYDTDQVGILGFDLMDSASGARLGMILDFDDTTANLLLKIRTEDGEERLIPFHEDFVTEVDEEGKRLFVDLPSGLLEI